jgi:hypothetical protein
MRGLGVDAEAVLSVVIVVVIVEVGREAKRRGDGMTYLQRVSIIDDNAIGGRQVLVHRQKPIKNAGMIHGAHRTETADGNTPIIDG